MNMKTNGHSLAASSLLALAVATIGMVIPTAVAAQDTAEAESSGPTVITVTARKREENLLEVPLAISALSGDDIEARGITSFNDLVDSTPGISVSNIAAGRNDRSFQQITVRGMTPSVQTSTLTASFVDGVPVASSTALNAVVDPARVEILRGPQNAYFGRNAFAGAINIVTQRPGNEFGGSVSASAGTRNSYDITASVEGPIVEDILAFRLTGRSWARDGSYLNGANPNQTLGDQQSRSGTLQLEFTPTDRLSVRALGIYSEDDDGPSAQGLVSSFEVRQLGGVVQPNGSTAGSVIIQNQSNCVASGLASGFSANEATANRNWFCGAIPELIGNPAQNTLENNVLYNALNNPIHRVGNPVENGVKGYGLVRQYYHLHLGADYELTDSLTFSSLTGYNNEYYSQLADLDNYDSSAITKTSATAATLPVIAGGYPYWSFPFAVERSNRDFSQEVRLSYDDGGALQAMLGGSYLYSFTEADLVNIQGEVLTGSARAASSASAPGRSRTFGIFGSVSYDVTDELNISLEGRWQRDRITAYTGGAGAFISDAAATEFGLPAGNFGPLSIITEAEFDNFLPRAIINYDVTPDMMVYASYSRAANVSIASFNSSILSTAESVQAARDLGLSVAVGPETLDNFEIGMKGTALNGMLQFTFAAYLAKWKDQLNNRQGFYIDRNGLIQTVSGNANTGNVELTGLEADLAFEPIDGLTFNAAGAINDSSSSDFVNPLVSEISGLIGDEFDGTQIPLSSKYSGNFGAQYSGEIDADTGFFIRADLSYKSKQFVTQSNLTWIRSRTVVDARAGLSFGDASLEVFVSNLFNNRRYVGASENTLLTPNFALTGAVGYVNVGLPELRTFGVKVSYDF